MPAQLPANASDGALAPVQPLLLDPAQLLRAKARLSAGDDALTAALDQLHADARCSLAAGPFSVTDKPLASPSGDQHDYLSLGPYWWPDPNQPDGLPWVRRDGQVNPQSRDDSTDRPRLERMADAVHTLALAAFFTAEPRFAQRALLLLRVWFLNPATCMNPHLDFAQAVPGLVPGRGIGIIDTVRLMPVLDAINLLHACRCIEPSERERLRRWFARYLHWLRTSKNGLDESRERNNHGTWYDAQVVYLALFLGELDLARQLLASSVPQRLDAHIAPDGSQPHELARTLSLSYSCFNLTGYFTLATLAQRVGIDLWRRRGPQGQSLRTAIEFLATYASPASPWPWPQISRFDHNQLWLLMHWAARVYPDSPLASLLAQHASAAFKRNHRCHLMHPADRPQP